MAETTIDGVHLMAVDYKVLKDDQKFEKLLRDLEKFSPDALTTREEKMAFWINVYNIFAVKMVTDHYPVESIRNIGTALRSVWKQRAGTVGGRGYTLNEIEHEILRPMGDPRIHAAIVCASVSCPDLRKEAFTAQRLDEQLDEQMKKFLANPTKGLRVDADRGTVHLSPIFDWFSDDFKKKKDTGIVPKILDWIDKDYKSQREVLSFVQKYAPAEAKDVLKKPSLKIAYMDYNWKVNEL